MDRKFPCKLCGHMAGRHYESVSGDEPICLDCATGTFVFDPEEHWHKFEGDNLKYMELQIKRKELLNDNNA